MQAIVVLRVAGQIHTQKRRGHKIKGGFLQHLAHAALQQVFGWLEVAGRIIQA